MENLSKVISKFDKNIHLKLERYFNESMEDANFKKLVARLNMPNKDLMKYTSKLQKTASELSHCQNCKNVLECNHEVGGYIYYPTANGNNLIFDYIPCKYQKKLERKVALIHFFLRKERIVRRYVTIPIILLFCI